MNREPTFGLGLIVNLLEIIALLIIVWAIFNKWTPSETMQEIIDLLKVIF